MNKLKTYADGQDYFDVIVQTFGGVEYLFDAQRLRADADPENYLSIVDNIISVFYNSDLPSGLESGFVDIELIGNKPVADSIKNPVLNYGLPVESITSFDFVSTNTTATKKSIFVYSDGQDYFDATIQLLGGVEYLFDGLKKKTSMTGAIDNFFVANVPSGETVDTSRLSGIGSPEIVAKMNVVINYGIADSGIISDSVFFGGSTSTTAKFGSTFSDGQDYFDNVIQMFGGVDYYFESKSGFGRIDDLYSADVASGSLTEYVKTETIGNKTVSAKLFLNNFVVVNSGIPSPDGLLSESGFNLLTESGGKLSSE
jgi:hypothetical protein